MKKLIGLLLVLTVVGCAPKTTKWEYKEIKVSNQNSSSNSGKVSNSNFKSSLNKLNELGEQGWELSSTYTILETEYPNFGNEGYHTGIKTNTRTKSIVYVLKKPKKEKK